MLRVRGPRDAFENVELRAEEHDPFVHDGALCLEHGVLGGLPEERRIALRQQGSVGVGGGFRDTGAESTLDLASPRLDGQWVLSHYDMLVAGPLRLHSQIRVHSVL